MSNVPGIGSYSPVNNAVDGGTNTNPSGSGLASLSSAINGQGPTVQGPNASTYNALYNQQQNQYNQQAGMTAQQAQAATIANPYQAQSQAQLAATQGNLGQLGGLLMNTARGQGPAVTAAQNQMTQATGQNIAAQEAMARSATGGALAQNAAGLAGQGNIASTLGTAASQSSQNLAQQELAAAGQVGNVYGQQGQLGLNQYQLEQQNAQQQAQMGTQVGLANAQMGNQFALGLGGLQNQTLGGIQQGIGQYGTQNLAAQQLQAANNAQANKEGGGFLGGLAGLGAAIAGAPATVASGVTSAASGI
jgi:hypothetical protein